MTGIERLREAAEQVAEYNCLRVGMLLDQWLFEIANQIERETLPRPCFEDGEPVKVGDRFLNALGRECVVHSVVSSDAFGRRIEGIVYASNCDCHITVGEGERVKRPEPPDTWERIEADIFNKINPCVYFGWSDKECGEGGGCPGHGPNTNCSKVRAQDLVRRCKALAGVE